MIEILRATENNIEAITQLAKRTWHATYTDLVPAGQIDYMLGLFYDKELLRSQMKDPTHHFLVLMLDQQLAGYAHAIELNDRVKLSKLYFAPEHHGKGLGKVLMETMESRMQSMGYTLIELCVNRGNPAQYFYEKMGYEITEAKDFPIGEYWMNDYVMQKKLH